MYCSFSDPPGAVEEASIIVQPSLTSIALSWSAATPFPGYPITHYSVELEDIASGNTVFSNTTNMTSVTIWNLDANQEYSLIIVTVSDSGSSAATIKTVMTSPLGEFGLLFVVFAPRTLLQSPMLGSTF